MSHGISKRDRQEGRKMGWHKLTIINPNLTLSDNWLTKWEITEDNLFTRKGVEVPFKVLLGSDDGLVIGKPFAGSYTPVTNKQFLHMIHEAISGIKGAVVESVGSVCNRGRVFVSISIEGMDRFVIGNREFLDYLNFGNGHDQTCAVWANASNTCTVCNNTFNMNLNMGDSQKGVRVKVKHSKDVIAKMENISEIIDAYAGTQARFKTEFVKLLNEPMKEAEAHNLFAGWMIRSKAGSEDRDLGPKTMKKVNRLTELFVSGAGNKGDNRADAFSAVTDFYSHESTRGQGKNVARQVFSSDFGIGRTAKLDFWNVIRSPQSIQSYVANGKKALALVP
jgi:hypothetical protein